MPTTFRLSCKRSRRDPHRTLEIAPPAPQNRAIRNHLVDAALEFFIRPYATNPMRQQTKTIILIGCMLAAPETLAVSAAMAEVGGSGPAASKPSSSPKSGTPATVVDDKDAGGVLGKNVRSAAGEDMGRIIDIIVSRTGQVRAAVIDFGGFLGVGSRKVAVAWNALRFPSAEQLDPVTVELTRDQVRLAPEYRPGEPIVVLGSPGAIAAEPPPRQGK
jgi:hypothetical protein